MRFEIRACHFEDVKNTEMNIFNLKLGSGRMKVMKFSEIEFDLHIHLDVLYFGAVFSCLLFVTSLTACERMSNSDLVALFTKFRGGQGLSFLV